MPLPQLGGGQRAQILSEGRSSLCKRPRWVGSEGDRHEAERGQGAEPKHHHATFGQGWMSNLIEPRFIRVRRLGVGGCGPGEQAEVARVGDRLGSARDLELAVDGLDLAPDGVDRHVQLTADLSA